TEGETLDAEAAEAADTLTDEIKSIDAHLKRLRVVESVKANAAKPVEGVRSVEDGEAARSGKVPAQVKANVQAEPGIRFARYVKCVGLAAKINRDPVAIATERYGQSDPMIVNVVKAA